MLQLPQTVSSQDIRMAVRNRRYQLSTDEQNQASHSLIEQFSRLPELLASQHIALYLSFDGELNTLPLIYWLWQKGKQTYLPVLHPFSSGHLLFLRYQATTPMMINSYGIREPILDQTQIKPVLELDLICTPLVAFDSKGRRLGMGGGYYDRTLHHWFNTGLGAKPIGLAHDCQFVDNLPHQAWDVSLSKIVTPNKIWQWES